MRTFLYKINGPIVWDGLLLSLMMLGVIFVSWAYYLPESLRLDEAQSLWQASHTPGEIIKAVAEDVHVPYYFLLLQSWMELFGPEARSARIMSLVFFLASIIAMYCLGKLAYGRGGGIFAALLLSVSPFMNWYGNEIRMYSLLTFVTILSYIFFLRFINQSRNKNKILSWRRFVGLGLVNLMGIYTHYLFVFVVASQLLALFMYRNRLSRSGVRKFVSTMIMVALLFMPWLFYWNSLESAGSIRPLVPMPQAINVFNTFSHFLFGFQNEVTNTILLSLWPMSVLLIFLVLRRGQIIPFETKFFLLGAILPIVLAFVISYLYQPMYLSRYVIVALPPLYLILAWFLSAYPKALSWTLKTALVVVMATALGIQGLNADAPVKVLMY